jgi:hypothetical protein
MSELVKVIEVSTAGSSVEDAVQRGLERVSRTVKGLRGAWISEVKVRTAPDGRIEEWRVCMRVSFVVD